ncbi:hypothetical protein NC651_035347 [Populus alba x Populus x berolinensis]|nr:hypothetical protein NC651_035347 [Populus alba x Populus x berolinensis]
MARPWVLVSLLLLIVFTSQLEWKQQFGNEIEASPNISQKDQQQHSSNREEFVKEKIILSQEKNIQKLNELVQSLRKQLQQCRSENYILNSTAIPLTEHLNGV